MKSTRSPTEFEQDNYDVTSILGYVFKNNRSRGAKYGPPERQRRYYQAKQMLKKARQKKHEKPPNNTVTMVRQQNVQDFLVYDRVERKRHSAVLQNCEWEGDVVAVVAPLGGVAQVVSHGIKVVGVHGEEGK